jgi:hypothetical protein
METNKLKETIRIILDKIETIDQKIEEQVLPTDGNHLIKNFYIKLKI